MLAFRHILHAHTSGRSRKTVRGKHDVKGAHAEGAAQR